MDSAPDPSAPACRWLEPRRLGAELLLVVLARVWASGSAEMASALPEPRAQRPAAASPLPPTGQAPQAGSVVPQVSIDELPAERRKQASDARSAAGTALTTTKAAPSARRH